MTDITELAQILKAEDVSPARMEWLKKLADMEYCASNPGHWLMSLKETNYLAVVALQCLEKNLALVEALEKAQAAERRWHRVASRIHEQACESDVKIDELEAIRAAAEKLVRCKGRYHSEQNYRALAALFGVNTPDLPPLDGEPRAVTVENLQESAYRAGLTAGWNLGLANNNDGFNKCLAAHAAGIKVEAE